MKHGTVSDFYPFKQLLEENMAYIFLERYQYFLQGYFRRKWEETY